MTALWYPLAHRDQQPDNGAFTGGPPKGLLHSTESVFGRGWATFKPGTHSHFEVTAQPATRDVAVRQFYPIDQPSRALVDGPLAVRTNRDGVIQVELGFQAQHVADVPAWFWTGTAALLRWIEDNAGVNPEHWATFEPYPKSYGATNGVRFAPSQWDAFDGWCGHMHAPDGNEHGDPGAIPVALLKRPTGPQRPAGKPPTLRKGSDRYAWVKYLKALLNLHGANLDVTSGIYDQPTQDRVKHYKRQHHIWPATGTTGPRVWNDLGVE
jgi:hypothetical protein